MSQTNAIKEETNIILCERKSRRELMRSVRLAAIERGEKVRAWVFDEKSGSIVEYHPEGEEKECIEAMWTPSGLPHYR